MNTTLHITSGDIAGGNLAKSGLGGEVFVWHDILYDGPRNPGWPTDDTLNARALFLEQATRGGLGRLESLALQAISGGCAAPADSKSPSNQYLCPPCILRKK